MCIQWEKESGNENENELHTLYFVINIYKQRFLQIVKFLKKQAPKLVFFILKLISCLLVIISNLHTIGKLSNDYGILIMIDYIFEHSVACKKGGYNSMTFPF